jgi:hypothetical protein
VSGARESEQNRYSERYLDGKILLGKSGGGALAGSRKAIAIHGSPVCPAKDDPAALVATLPVYQ